MTATVDELFAIEVSEDRLHAFVRCITRGGYATVSPGQLAALLESAQIEITDQVTQRILEFVSRARNDGPLEEPFEIACGEQCEEGTDARLVWSGHYRQQLPARWTVHDEREFYDLSPIVDVAEGNALGILLRKAEGKDGCDVHGTPIPRENQPHDLLPGEGVRLGEDGETLFAQRNGRVEISNGEVSIRQCRGIDGSKIAGGAKIKADGAIHVSGILRRADVVSDQSVIVDHTIESAQVSAGNHVVTADGICGENRGSVSAGGDVVARYAENCSIRAGGDVRILNSLTDCRVHALGRIVVADGVITGGSLYAREGVVAQTIGRSAQSNTAIQVGIGSRVLAYVQRTDQKINALRHAAERIDELTKPLMTNLKRLSPTQRERATELFYQADAIRTDLEQLRADKEHVLQSAKPAGAVFVEAERRVYGGTQLSFDGRICVVESELRGPVRVGLLKVNREQHVVATNTFTNTQRILPSRLPSPTREDCKRQGQRGYSLECKEQ